MIKNKTHVLFLISVISKGFSGLLELLGGLFLFSSSAFTEVIIFLTEHELGEDPRDFLANKVIEFLPYVSVNTQLFAAWYFLIHGIFNITLVVCLLLKRLWAYPAAMAFHSSFIVYQLYRYTHTHSVVLILLSLYDALVVFLIWREYQFLLQSRLLAAPPEFEETA